MRILRLHALVTLVGPIPLIEGLVWSLLHGNTLITRALRQSRVVCEVLQHIGFRAALVAYFALVQIASLHHHVAMLASESIAALPVFRLLVIERITSYLVFAKVTRSALVRIQRIVVTQLRSGLSGLGTLVSGHSMGVGSRLEATRLNVE